MALLIIFAVIFVAFLIFKIFDMRSVKNMTYEKLLTKCKKLIDEGKVSSVQSTLMHHPKLLLLHFNELQTTLTNYAREVEEGLKDK